MWSTYGDNIVAKNAKAGDVGDILPACLNYRSERVLFEHAQIYNVYVCLFVFSSFIVVSIQTFLLEMLQTNFNTGDLQI